MKLFYNSYPGSKEVFELMTLDEKIFCIDKGILGLQKIIAASKKTVFFNIEMTSYLEEIEELKSAKDQILKRKHIMENLK